MNEIKPIRASWGLTAVCLALSGFGLSAVPFVGTRYGDWPEAIALAIGLLPFIYLCVDVAAKTHRRLADLEAAVNRLQSGQK